ncbi:hypothetical protein GIB67_040687 [Kingdonia uniflora]|uniref:UTP-monosaccharide-1-phosphate uridylyltransferase n=1 Tax=Kingdonia uniflora TaxID=39325 RepID=A0A7J7KU90_9MAGN|nr:hypothetical protein GIB67_040687 [Kingdonia uniflora]
MALESDFGATNGDWASSAPNLQKNLSLLSPDQIEDAKMLLEMGQTHLFEVWSELGVDDQEKKGFFQQVTKLNKSYPKGLAAYIQNARRLLADSKEGRNPFDGFKPSVPSGETLKFGDTKFDEFEKVGVKEAHNAAFVLVAGGLGERLGYNGIKLALPSECTTSRSFLQHYVESILALQESSCRLNEDHRQIPLVIMTSDDTDKSTQDLLRDHNNFGMIDGQVVFLKQEKVACLDDNDARLAKDPHNSYRIQTKPHGHGDVHSLLKSSGLLDKWHDSGLKWVLFFQDTNGLLFKAIPASLGVSSEKRYDVNSLAVSRKAKEAIGGITKLTHTDGRTMVINVEYNQLDPLLRATGYADGDVNCETGYSPFPGNINQLILKLDSYIEELNKTEGAIPEFVNPKYKDSSKTSFKSSTRLECMMQDYPKTLSPSARVGFTVMDTWLAYAPVKNNPEDAAKVPKGNPYHSATSGEMAIYRANSKILQEADCKIADPVIEEFNGQEVEVWPRIVWEPKWALTFADVKEKVHGHCSISQRSTLVIKGRNVAIEDLTLDGTLIISSAEGAEDAKVTTVRGKIQNKGFILEKVDKSETSEIARIRGFRIKEVEKKEVIYSKPENFHFKS